jgi:hypothetical protein
MLSSLFWDRQPWTALPLNMGRMGYPETSVSNHQPTLRKNPQMRRPELHSSGSLKFLAFRL